MTQAEKRSLIVFTIAYIALIIAMAIIAGLFHIQANSALRTLVVLGAGIIAAESFTKSTQRAPRPEESRRLALYCLLLIITMALIFIAVATIIADIPWLATLAQMNSKAQLMLGGLLIFITLIYYAILRFCFGYLARKRAAKYPTP